MPATDGRSNQIIKNIGFFKSVLLNFGLIGLIYGTGADMFGKTGQLLYYFG